MDKIDFKKELKHLYAPSAKEFTVVDVPPMQFLMIDGHGDPSSAIYQEAVSALYALAYTIKFALKPQGIEYAVPPLEGLWWTKDMATFSLEAKDQWDWTMMILQPDSVTTELVEQARQKTAKKKALSALPNVRLGSYHEGLSVQILYFGAYDDEHPTIARMHAFIAEQGYETNGKHHEIYLGDPRKTTPDKLKTILRQPIRATA